VSAWNGAQGFTVLFDELVLEVAFINHSGTWDDQVTVFSADWAGSVMGLLYFLVVGGSPVTDAIETESMCTVLKDSKSLTIG